MKKLINLAFVLVVVGCSNAQKPPTSPAHQTVLPGDAALNTELMKPHKIKYTKSGGYMSYIMKEVEKNSRPAYELAIYFNQDESGKPDLIYFDKETLGYLGRKMEMKDYTLEVAFSKNHFGGNLTPTEDQTIHQLNTTSVTSTMLLNQR